MKFLLDQDVPEPVGSVLDQEGHAVSRLRQELPVDSEDAKVLKHAAENGAILITCNRDDFLQLAPAIPHVGIIILVRRNSRLAECAAILRLVRTAGESGLKENINFA